LFIYPVWSRAGRSQRLPLPERYNLCQPQGNGVRRLRDIGTIGHLYLRFNAGRGITPRDRTQKLLKVFILLDMLGGLHQSEARMVAASVARRKFLSIYARNLMLRCVPAIMGYSIDTGMLYSIARLELFRHSRAPTFTP